MYPQNTPYGQVPQIIKQQPMISTSNPFETNFNYPEHSFTNSSGSKTLDKPIKTSSVNTSNSHEMFSNPFSDPPTPKELNKTQNTVNSGDF